MSLITPVILCGGNGTRLWPLSREHRLKQFVPLIGGKSLLQATLAPRLLPHAGSRARNSATGTVMWGAALLPACIAVSWPTRSLILALGFGGCTLVYALVYARLSQFRSCFSAATARSRTARANVASFRKT